MSATGFYARTFKAGGDPYFSLPLDILFGLDPFYRTAAIEVGGAMMFLAREEGNFSPTYAEIAAILPSDRGQPEGSPPGHRSHSFVGKGRYALAVIAGVIERIRDGNEVMINWVRGLKPARDPGPASPPAPPPAPPPEEKREKNETTTTGEPPSSSSLASLPGGEFPPDLLDAVDLVPGMSRERLQGWVALAGVELTRRVVAWTRIWGHHPRPEKRPASARWAEEALLSWKRKLDLGFTTLRDIDDEIALKRRKWGPKPAAAKAVPSVQDAAPQPLAAEELADLIGRCTMADRNLSKYARVELRLALGAGQVPPELVATIPPELLEPALPRAP